MEKKLKLIIELLKAQNIQQKEVLSFKEALSYLNTSASFLYKLTANNRITFFKPSGKLIYFKKINLDEWILRNEQIQEEDLDSEIDNYLKEKDGK